MKLSTVWIHPGENGFCLLYIMNFSNKYSWGTRVVFFNLEITLERIRK